MFFLVSHKEQGVALYFITSTVLLKIFIFF